MIPSRNFKKLKPKRENSMLRAGLLMTAISLAGCASTVDEPEFYRCGLSGMQLYCVNNKTKKERLVDVSDPSVWGAQCILPSDYSKYNRWIGDLKEQAERNQCEQF